MTIVQWRSTLESEIWSADEAELADRRQRASSGDAESAFWLSELYRLCLSQPRTEAALDRAILSIEEALESVMESRPNMDQGWAEERLDHSFKAFQTCSLIDPELELDREALAWLGIAADLGHPGAQRLYHAHAHELLLGQRRPFGRYLAIMEPALIEEFKIRADRYAQTLLASGDRRALLLMARMMALGDVYPQDLVKAYAYALAAQQDGTPGLQPSANAWIQQLTPQISQDELSAARALATELSP